VTTIRVELIALWVRDLDAMCALYADAFGATVGPLYENPAKGFRSRFLSSMPGLGSS
jgi:lactoylglutathione lyase